MTSSLKELLNREWKAPRFVHPARFAIEPVVRELERRFQGVPVEIKPPTNLLKEVEQLLSANGGNLSPLNRRQRKALPYILWESPQEWSENQPLVEAYLDWAGRDWPRAPKWLWRHYVLNMDAGSLATCRLGPWLAARQDALPTNLRDFSVARELFNPPRGIANTARILLSGHDFIGELAELKLDRNQVLASAFMLGVVKRLGEQLRDYRQGCEIAIILKRLLEPLGTRPTRAMHAGGDLHQSALKSIVEGLVIWADRQGEPRIGETLALLHILIGDPRLPGGWWHGIDPWVQQKVESWLTQATLTTFFQFMGLVPTNRPDMVKEREEFWRGYDGSISRAWLVAGSDAEPMARKLLGKSFATFRAPDSRVERDHVGLLLQIGSLIIQEMNKEGFTLFWPSGDTTPSDFYNSPYSRSKQLDACPSGPTAGTDRFRLSHHTNWQDKYEREIAIRTGIRRRQVR